MLIFCDTWSLHAKKFLFCRAETKKNCARATTERAMPHFHPPSTTCACPFSVPVHVMRSSRTFVGKWNFKCDWWKCEFCVTLIFYAADVCIYSTAYLLLYFVVTKRMCAADIKFSFYWRAKKGLLTFLWCHLLVLRERPLRANILTSIFICQYRWVCDRYFRYSKIDKFIWK